MSFSTFALRHFLISMSDDFVRFGHSTHLIRTFVLYRMRCEEGISWSHGCVGGGDRSKIIVFHLMKCGRISLGLLLILTFELPLVFVSMSYRI